MPELTFHPYEHPPAPVMTEAERRAWIEPERPHYEPDERTRRLAIEYEERLAYEAAER